MQRNAINGYRRLLAAVRQLSRLRERPVYDCGDGVFATVLSGGPTEYSQLRQELLAGGEPLWERSAAGNLFCCFSSGQNGKEAYTVLGCFPSEHSLRVLYCQGNPMPERLGDAPTESAGVTLTQVCPDDTAANFGMCYVFSLGQGHFLIYDGNGDAGNDHDRLWQCLCRDTPPGERPVVDAWILTHPHWDHVSGPVQFAKKYGGMTDVRCLLYNFPSLSVPIQYREIGSLATARGLWLNELHTHLPQAAVYKPHTGQRFTVGTASVEILYTHEDLYPHGPLAMNDCSMVTLVTVRGKKLFFPADLSCGKACRMLAGRYGDYLKSDWYQAAHHGWDTEALAFYPFVNAPDVLWPLRKRDWERIQSFPATQVMVQEMTAQKRRFHIAWEDDISVEL